MMGRKATGCLVGCALLVVAAVNVGSVYGFVSPLSSVHDGRRSSPSSLGWLSSQHVAAPRPRRCGWYGGGRGLVMMGRRAAKIANVKGREDAKRAKTFARIGKKIIMAVKAGGPSEDSNKSLADAIKEAKRNSVPKDNIARAIKRAVDGSQGDFKEVIYEAYGHGGTGMVITALTDNVNRAIADVKTVWKKHEVKQAAQGSVLFQFDKRGRIEVAGEADEEKVIEAAIESGVDDVEVVEGEDEGTTWVLTQPKDLATLADALGEVGINGDSGLALVPSSLAEVDEETVERNMAAVEALLELEDVDSVAHNMG